MKILVTGATGFLGFRIVEKLAGEGINVVAAGRKIADNHYVDNSNVVYKLGSLEDDQYVASLFGTKPEMVINCASLSSPWGKYETYYQSNVLSQKNLINESKKAGVIRFIYISSPTIYYRHKHVLGVKESDLLPSSPVNNYAKTKLEAEVLLKTSGLNYITLRPRALIGRGDTVIMPRLIRAYREGKLRVIGDGQNLADLTCVGNVVLAVECAMKAPHEALGKAYNISNGSPVKLWPTINGMFDALGYARIKKRIPINVAMMAAWLMEKKSILSGYAEPALTRYSVGVLAYSMTLDISQARKLLDYESVQTTEEGIREFVDWYKTQQHD
ncbi:MAG: NAD-dependent epimerase/dehydratase family protein [Roseivirga sp.]|nr:NAD-dependent epimerase/dehydratase family protein [Roseivirga sp.]